MYNGRIPKKPVRFVTKQETVWQALMGGIALIALFAVLWFIFVSLAGG